MQDRYFSTLPSDMSDARFFRMLESMRMEYLRRLKGWGGGERVVRRVGGSVEFAGHRNYNPGDDLRYLDWHMLARLDNPYTKTFHDQEYYHVHLLLDTSASMDGMQDGLKFQLACDVTTAIGYLILANDDRLRLISFPDPRSSLFSYASQRFLMGKNQIPVIRRFLSEKYARGTTTFNTSLSQYVHQNRRHLDTVVIVSDFLAPLPEITRGLLNILSANGQLVVVRIVDEKERTLTPEDTQVKVKDVETGQERMLTLDEPNQMKYETEFETHRASLQAFCRTYHISYAEVDTAHPWYDPLQEHAFLQQLKHLGLLRSRRGS